MVSLVFVLYFYYVYYDTYVGKEESSLIYDIGGYYSIWDDWNIRHKDFRIEANSIL
ncbi:hypothetical protein K140096H11_22520 [Bacteroides intestinalis]